ncbi:metallophosphoesterase [Streptococcus moroccensis]|uniref:Serine/threonine protein phosphatase 1 n=1 Tax=Streptococcus moroccensis TaxID=1451356 RepID=A0ABT9YNC7_9STRE|nr:metallophosphoesterase [Streptococcus moroccensis]MDQ0221498.1 serine/threonine protein phosphatase 1 [Streptococcus moroccensis]
MKEKWFVVGDVHGEFDLLEKLLKHWDEETEDLVFLGDLADRGPKSKDCLLTVMDLVASGRAKCLKGNHEDMLQNWLEDPEQRFLNYLRNGGKETIDDLLYEGASETLSPVELAQAICQTYPDLVSFLESLPYYSENDFCIAVHAGINLDLPDWRQTSDRDFVWMREEFYNHPARPEKLVVFGHTPVQYLHSNAGDTQLWYQNNRLNIDGGAAYQGALHGVVLSSQGIEADYQLFHPQYQWQENLDQDTF